MTTPSDPLPAAAIARRAPSSRHPRVAPPRSAQIIADHRYMLPTVREIAVPDPSLHDQWPGVSPNADAVQAREQERRRLSRDLHDGVGAALTGMILTVGVAQMSATGGTRDLLVRVQRDLVEVAAELRLLINDRRPPALAELGLAEALRRRARQLEVGGGLQIGVVEHAPPSCPPVAPVVELAAYRIAGEALANVVRHAQASRCDVAIAHHEGELRITVRDNGAGLRAPRPGGVGLVAMRERAAELGGRCDCHFVPGGGTIVECTLPSVP